jgi:hypothetical protein
MDGIIQVANRITSSIFLGDYLAAMTAITPSTSSRNIFAASLKIITPSRS